MTLPYRLPGSTARYLDTEGTGRLWWGRFAVAVVLLWASLPW